MAKKIYTEPIEVADPYRKAMLEEVNALVHSEQKRADQRRKRFFQPDYSSLDAYEKSIAEYRTGLAAMLGWPLTMTEDMGTPAAKMEPVAKEDLGTISRVWIETLPGVQTYGLYFRPKGKGPFPLVISQHGGGGTAELCSGLYGSSANYNDMTRRVWKRGVAVFAPQLLLWDPRTYQNEHYRDNVDRKLKQVGGSLTALELYRIRRSLDYFTTRREIDPNRIGMIGLSYGGFYTLFTAALDTRIRAAVSSCFFNNRKTYDFPDWVWFDSAGKFLDAEVAAMVCPRALYVEVGKKDPLFDVRHARPVVKPLQAIYKRMKASKQFHYEEHSLAHDLDTSEKGIDFLCKHLDW